MKNFSDEVARLVTILRRYLRLEVEYVKLTATEKASVLMAGIAVGIIVLVLTSFMMFMLAFTCVELFKMIMSPVLSYLSTAGVFLIMLLVVLLFKDQWIVNPISRFITRILFDKKPED